MALIFALALQPMGAYVAILLAWLAIVLVAALAGLGPLRTVRGALFALPFVLAAFPLIFTRPGDPLGTIELGPLTLTISGEGLRMFTTIALKSWVSVQAALLLAFTTPFHELVDALRELRMPKILVAIIGFMYRYLGVMTDEASRMMRARASRSADPVGRGGGPIRWRAAVVGHMVGSLFLRSYERSERIYNAMQARGFDGEFRYLQGPPLGRVEITAFALGLAAIAVYALLGLFVLPVL